MSVNKFKSSSVAGEFRNVDLPNSEELSFAYFQRDIQVDGNIINLNLNNLLDSKVDTGYFDDFVANLNANLDSKANITYVDDEITILNDLINTKANISYVDDKVSQLVDSSPATLDTLNELANALGDDPNFATTVSTNIGLKADKTYTDSQLALKSNIASPSFTGMTNIVNLNHTGTINSPAIQTAINTSITSARTTLLSNNVNSSMNAYLHFGNHALQYNNFQTQSFGSISANKFTAGEAEMNFIQNGLIPGATKRAFNFLIATSNTTFTELMKIYKNGDMVVSGDITTPNLNATTSIISPTITTINTNIGLKTDKTYTDAQLLLKTDKTYTDAQLLLKDSVVSVDNKLLLKSDLVYVDDEILNLQNQINNIEGNFNPNSDVSFNNLTVSGTITNTTLTNLINTKANISNPTFTGTSIIPIISNQTMYCNGQIYFHAGNPNTPSSRIHIGSTDSMFWDNVLNVQTYWRWGASNIVKQVFYANGDISIPGSIINCPTITGINSNINLKADKTYTDNQLLFKTDKTFTDSAISTINTQLNLKLNKTGDTLTDVSINGTNYLNSILYVPPDKGFYFYLPVNGISNYSSRLVLAGYDALVWDNPRATDIRFRWGATNIQKHTFSSDGNLAIAGSLTAVNGTFSGVITGPTITGFNNSIATINSNISNVNNTSDLNKPVSTAQQSALDLKANINNASFTGTMNVVNFNNTGTFNSPALQTILNNYVLTTTFTNALNLKLSSNVNSATSAYLHFSGHSLPYTEYLTQNFGAISANRMGVGQAEMNFIQNGYIPGATYRAFNFMIATSNTTFTELMKINKNGDMVVTGNVSTPILTATTSIVSPTITTINNNIATINSNISNVNNTSDMNKPVSTLQQSALDLKASINNTTFTGTTTIVNLNHTGTLNSPALQTTLNNYALLNSSPTFTGTIKGKVYSGDLSRSASNIVFTASTLPSTILQDTGVSDTTIGIPNMPIGTRFTVMKTSPTVILYSTDSNVFFYSRRTSPFWHNNLTMCEDSRTFIRAEIINPSNLAMIQVWMTESSHTYNLYETINTSIIGAFMLDGPNNGRTATATYRPITCSNKIFGPGNSDDGYIVNEGFSLIVYDGENYTGTSYTLSNYMAKETPGPFHFPSPMINNMQSCKLYYNLVEVVISGISI